MNWITKILGQQTAPLIDKAVDIADKFIETPEEKKEFIQKAYDLEVEDRNVARGLYAKDSGIQKILAIVFLAGYMSVTGVLLYWAFNHASTEMTDFQISLISTIFGAMSAKLNTVVDFFFGASVDSTRGAKDISKMMKK